MPVEIQQCNQANPYFSVDKSNPKDFFGARLVCQRTILPHQFLSCQIPRVILTNDDDDDDDDVDDVDDDDDDDDDNPGHGFQVNVASHNQQWEHCTAPSSSML